MYDIDVNFLRDRKLDTQTGGTNLRRKQETPMSEKLPLFIGSGVAVALIGLSGGALLLINSQKGSLEKEIAELEVEINRLQVQNEQVAAIQAQIDQVSQETQALTSVFENIKPWSALLEEISFLIPANVQVQSIAQSNTKSWTISGFADNYDSVNNFLLTLKNSRFLNAEETTLTSTNKTNNPYQIEQDSLQLPNPATNQIDNATIQLPDVVTFNITATVNDTSSAELISYLRRRGAIGLVSRIETLKRKGAIQP